MATRRSLRSRLGVTLGLTAGLSVVATALISFWLVGSFARSNAERELRARAEAIAAEAERIDIRTSALRRVLRASGDHTAFIGPRGAVIAEDIVARRVAAAVDLTPVLSGRALSDTVTVDGSDYAYVALPAGGRRVGGVLLARPTGLAADIWRPVIVRVAIAGGAAVALAVLASALMARTLARPVRRMAEATARVAGGNLGERVPVEGQDEIADLARRFNEMAMSLSEARRREQEFLSNVSHELRTPITAIRGYAEAIADGAVRGREATGDAVAVIRDEAARLERLVQDVIDLARLGERDFSLSPADVDLAETIREAVRAHAAAARSAGVTLAADADVALACHTDPGRVRQILSNLVDNALRVTPPGGGVRLFGRRDGRVVVLEVSDTGPGIAAEDLPHVFERAYLWSASKGERPVGTGLGLAIVRELAAALGGRIEVESEPGRGTTFRLLLAASEEHVAS